MSIRFAAPARSMSARMSCLAARTFCPDVANDNGRTATPRSHNDAMLMEALHLLVAKGLSAARFAGNEAESAAHAGDHVGYRWWIGVCHVLDARMAMQIEARRRASA